MYFRHLADLIKRPLGPIACVIIALLLLTSSATSQSPPSPLPPPTLTLTAPWRAAATSPAPEVLHLYHSETDSHVRIWWLDTTTLTDQPIAPDTIIEDWDQQFRDIDPRVEVIRTGTQTFRGQPTRRADLRFNTRWASYVLVSWPGPAGQPRAALALMVEGPLEHATHLAETLEDVLQRISFGKTVP